MNGVDYESLVFKPSDQVCEEIERAKLKVGGVTSAKVEMNAGPRPGPISVRLTLTIRQLDYAKTFDEIFTDFGAYISRTRSGAWLVKGRGPTRRYSTMKLAGRAAGARR